MSACHPAQQASHTGFDFAFSPFFTSFASNQEKLEQLRERGQLHWYDPGLQCECRVKSKNLSSMPQSATCNFFEVTVDFFQDTFVYRPLSSFVKAKEEGIRALMLQRHQRHTKAAAPPLSEDVMVAERSGALSFVSRRIGE
ncbi:hypothetical protein QOT17_000239 [Balamuthia mandrillaris]